MAFSPVDELVKLLESQERLDIYMLVDTDPQVQLQFRAKFAPDQVLTHGGFSVPFKTKEDFDTNLLIYFKKWLAPLLSKKGLNIFILDPATQFAIYDWNGQSKVDFKYYVGVNPNINVDPHATTRKLFGVNLECMRGSLSVRLKK